MAARMDRALELLVVWVLSTSALGMAAALSGYFLPAQVLLASLLLAGAYAWRTRNARDALGSRPQARDVAVLLVVCLFFRLPAYNYILGGQDEGVYVNIAHYIERTRGIKVSDGPLLRLEGTSFVRTYLAANRRVGPSSGSYLPGVYLHARPTGSELQFQFYDLFPAWMALFIGIFGSTFGVCALTLFAVIGVLFMYRLALVVSGSQRVAVMAGLLLAVSPLHAFFSKFPVTEVPTLAFSLAGFTFLAAFWRRGDASGGGRWLVTSASCFGALFFTRISGFMYMPFVIALAAAAAVLDNNRPRQRAIGLWALAVLALYVLSVLYGWHWSYQYAHDIYASSFKRLYGNGWKAGAGLTVILALVAWAAVAWASRAEPARLMLARTLVHPARIAVSVIVGLGLLYGLFKIYRLGWSADYINNSWLSRRWHLSGHHWQDVWASSLFALVVYTGLFVPVLGVVWLLRRQTDPMIEYLRVFVAGFLVYVAVLQWVIPYGPYYTRYLLSELVPYMLLFVTLVWSTLRGYRRALVSALLVISLGYAGLASTKQLGKRENAGLYGELKQLVAPVDPGDLILLEGLTSVPAKEIKTSLIYTFNKNVVTLSSESLRNSAYIAALNARYDDVYLASTHMEVPKGFETLDSTHVHVWAFKATHAFPRQLALREDPRLYLSRLIRPVIPLGHAVPFAAAGEWNNWLFSGWSTSESWGTWSLGSHATLGIDPRQLPEVPDALALKFRANVFVTPSHPRQRIEVRLAGALAGSYKVDYPDTTLAFDVVLPPEDLQSARKIHIGFELPDAISPKAAGVSGDSRVIALGLVSVTASAVPVPETASTAQVPTSGAFDRGRRKAEPAH